MRHFIAIHGFRRAGRYTLLVIACASLSGCHSRNTPAKPSIQITQVPVADPGGKERLDYIAGRVSGAQPGQQVVLFAHSANGVWWVQPLSGEPFTKIQPDSTWKNSTHLGMEYAALLVEAGYKPQLKTLALPGVGNGVIAVTTMTGKANTTPNPTKVVHFSGFDWNVRTVPSERGGEQNNYDPANVWTDQKGYLHLKMAQRNGQWTCAELTLNHSLGYGSYRFVVEDLSHLAPSAVLGLYTWDEEALDTSHNELDIELTRWGNPDAMNAQYVIQPFYVPENVFRFAAPAGVVSYQFRWEPGNLSFKGTRGAAEGQADRPFSEHVFTVGVPPAANEAVHMDLYDFHHSKSNGNRPAEVVIEKFEYLP